jgi:hypothetical protein
MSKELRQANLFGGSDTVNSRPHPSDLPRPVNDWALSLYILMNHPRGVTVFEAMKNYGMVKFQERLNEILADYPYLATKEMVKVPKRLGRIVSVMRYKIASEGDAIDLYMTELNKKGGSKILKQKNK